MPYNSRSISFMSLAVLTAIFTLNAFGKEIPSRPEPIQTKQFSSALFAEENWAFALGGGVMYRAKYEGSNNYHAILIPDISASYKEGLIFANWNGIGGYPIYGENYKIGASIGPSFGREEKDDRENLRGMGDIDMGLIVNLLGEYNFGLMKLSGKISKGDKEYGTTAKLEVSKTFSLTEKLKLKVAAGNTWADEEHMQSYFGITPAQAMRSGYNQYEAKSGIKSAGVSIGTFYSITKNWEAKVMLTADKLLDNAADSPLTKKDFNTATMATLSYKF
ncbi:MipA/OmpV family protein [Sulfurospirillum multivorans]|uniref:Outer membrane protein, MipA-like n=2 Tax=Sulfurospirillum multivorans TaxID=66821 RepID=A0AA86ALW9_SULMK|nr:MipA/OmpV family protein [Sulfurospirillum multivorans]AHJ12182.1 outer membrane protein, MipA-like [Sulfurospirillum multivorans DSM 12446]QEH05682.1 outer membrane protein, MipA-like [Sulfurospirillum multivorans]